MCHPEFFLLQRRAGVVIQEGGRLWVAWREARRGTRRRRLRQKPHSRPYAPSSSRSQVALGNALGREAALRIRVACRQGRCIPGREAVRKDKAQLWGQVRSQVQLGNQKTASGSKTEVDAYSLSGYTRAGGFYWT
jgi:hypothetical protein